MEMFILGMIVMWILCGLVVLLCNQLNASEDIKDIVVGGFWWLPIVVIGNIIYKK